MSVNVSYGAYQRGHTVLMWTAWTANLELFQLLINNGALSSINTPDNVNI
jgi:hypothetical protein